MKFEPGDRLKLVDVRFDDGETHPVFFLHRLKKIDDDVPSPPVAGKGVHAQPPHVAEAGKEETKKETIPWPTPSRSKPSF